MKNGLMLTRLELLEACNEISKKYGGTSLGCVMGYRNQHLIAVELRDMTESSRMFRMVAAMKGIDDADLGDAEEEVWIRLGFCQSTITRAPRGGFTLTIDYDVLCKCRTTAHVIGYFETMIGKAAERDRKHELWKEMVEAVEVDHPGLRRAFRLTREVAEIAGAGRPEPDAVPSLFAQAFQMAEVRDGTG